MGAIACLFALGFPTQAAELRIAGVRVDAADRLQVTAPADAASYYVLRRGSDLGDLQAPVALALGTAATITLTDPATMQGRSAAFYRLQQVPLAQPLDSDGDGIDDVFELRNPAFLNPLRAADAAEDFDDDGVSNLAEFRAGTPLDVDSRPTAVTTSPFPGEGDVSVNRETVLRFSHALALDTLLRADDLHAEFAGRRLLARAELSSDRRTATLFYLEPLPGSARVRVWFEGDAVRDATGRLVDADGDGRPGGRLALDFDTVNTTPTPNTAVIGRVFASELVPSPTGLQSVNQPIAGVTVTVDGQEETLRAVTDAAGNFRLEPAPAGRFFVHVDGRTSPRSAWPEGDYYPFVGKAWVAAAGHADNLAGGNGEIFLPLIRAGTLQPVSATAETRIMLPPAVAAANPALAGIEVVVPPNALFSESGARGGKIGLAPVAPDRLPEPLPPGLNLPVVITVQSDGGQNFDRPVPVRFPNLPDLATALPLPAGSRSALWSFNHDLGRWEVVGPMQVSADGAYVETLAGVGIRQPGWHGQFPGCPNYKAPNAKPLENKKNREPKPKDPPPKPDPCNETPQAMARRANNRAIALHELQACGATHQTEQEFNRLRGRLTDSLRTMRRETETLRGAIAGLTKEKARDAIDAAAARIIAAHNLAEATADELNSKGPRFCADLEAGASCLGDAYELIQENCDGSPGCPPSRLDEQLCKDKRGIGRRNRELSDFIAAACNGGDPSARVSRQVQETRDRLQELRRKIDVTTALSPRASRAGLRAQGSAEDALFQELDEIITQLEQGVGGGFTEIDAALLVLEEFRASGREIRETAMEAEAEDFGLAENGLFYAIELPTGIVRGLSSDQGTFEVILPPNTAYRIHLFDPETLSYGWADDRTGVAGVRAALPSVPWVETALPDTDGDGLADAAEFVIGANPTVVDSDHDGLSDGSEIAQGSNPLDGRPAVVGILNSLRLPGEAVHVTTANGLAAVALGDAGVALVNIVGGLAPSVIGAVDTPGSATAVALGNSVLAVADGAQGLALVDITDPAGARIFRQVKFTGRIEAVAILGNRVYAGTSDNRVHTLDATSGERLRSLTLTFPVKRLTPGGGLLYAATASSVAILRPTPAGLELVGSFFPALPAGLEVKDVFVADGVAWVTYPRGVITFDVSDPTNPRPLHTGSTGQFGWKQSVLNGTGLLLGAVGRNSTLESPAGDHELSLYNVSAPDAEPALVVTLPTPGIAYSLAVDHGRAYVADGQNGFLVLNYLATDTGTTPPTVAARVLAANNTVESGKFFTAAAAARDDVQVRSVEFYLDGERIATDASPPFEQTLPAPRLTATKTGFVVRAKAFDTGGNEAWSEPVTITLAEDITAPELVRVSPADATGSEELRQFVATFSEPINHDSVTAESFRLRDAGPDLAFDTADDALVTRGGFAYDDVNSAVYLQFSPPLAAGRYRLELAATLTDRAGLALPTATTSETFTGYGLRAEYSQLGFFEPLALLLSRLDANVDFNWNFAGPDPSVGGTFFARWSGRITPRFSEVYEFALPQAEGSGLRRLWLDGQLVFSERFLFDEEARGRIFLEAGRAHDLILELDFGGSGRTRLTWSSPSQPEETVPFVQLRPTVNARPAALLAALGEPTLDRVFLRFDQALDLGSAEAVANYVLTPAVPIRAATLQANGRDVELLTAPLPADTRHTVRVAGVRDTAANVVTGEAAFTTARLVPGAVRRELYTAPGFNDAVTASPGWPVFPYDLGTLPSFANAPGGTGADANRALAFLQPAVTSTRRFVLSAGAGSALLFATPDGAERALLTFPPVNPPFFQVSDPFRLEAGQRYRLDLRGGVANSPARFSLSTAVAAAYDRSLVVEVEDYDFGGGQHVAAASGQPYVPGQYANRAGTPEVDFHFGEQFAGNNYRSAPPEQPGLATDAPGFHGGVRVPVNYSLSSPAEGHWLNYSRVFAAGRHRVYLVFYSNTYATHYRLGRVSAGVGTTSQTLTDLGRFEGDVNGGRIFPLTDEAGQATDLDLEGVTTLRLTGTGFNDAGPDYLLFVPVADVPADPLVLLPPSPQNPPLAGPELLAPVPADGTGFLLRETWTGVTTATLAEFRASAAALQQPNETARVDRFELTSFQVFEQSVTRLRGWVVPYRSGPHRFFLSARRQAELFLSPDNQVEHLALAATEPVGAQTARSWFKSSPPTRDPAAPENWTAILNLNAGQRYAVEVWVRHSEPNDHVGVAWFPPGTLQPANGMEPVSGLHLGAPDPQ